MQITSSIISCGAVFCFENNKLLQLFLASSHQHHCLLGFIIIYNLENAITRIKKVINFDIEKNSQNKVGKSMTFKVQTEEKFDQFVILIDPDI